VDEDVLVRGRVIVAEIVRPAAADDAEVTAIRPKLKACAVKHAGLPRHMFHSHTHTLIPILNDTCTLTSVTIVLARRVTLPLLQSTCTAAADTAVYL
jgi:predicted secreted Zn-dependent protease